MTTLYDDGIRKVLEGITTIEEVFRVAKKGS
jgi:type II secretory ATPase GspE/PulE/Tfp pilus assembly ATPase PilB-like protein